MEIGPFLAEIEPETLKKRPHRRSVLWGRGVYWKGHVYWVFYGIQSKLDQLVKMQLDVEVSPPANAL